MNDDETDIDSETDFLMDLSLVIPDETDSDSDMFLAIPRNLVNADEFCTVSVHI